MPDFKPNLAVVIGINDYVLPIPQLKTPTNDAKKLHEILSKNEYKVLELLDKEATKDKLISLIDAFKEQKIPFEHGPITVEPDDRVLFYFAGHGILDELDNEDGLAGFLLPQNARDDSSTWLPMTQLYKAINALHCRHLLVILDCCFAGAFLWAERHRNAVRQQKVYQESFERFRKGNARQVITSAAADEKAADFLFRVGQQNNGNSPFAELLLKALEGDADMTKDKIITATELYVYLRQELGKTKVKQTPGLWQLKGHDKGEYIFTLPGFDPSKLEEAEKKKKINPYRGLESFEEEHSELFFGRETSIEKLRTVVAQQPLTVVMGASGSGKSSLVKAGLIPRLTTKLKEKEKESQEQWCILGSIRPGKSPQQNLKILIESVLARQNLQNSNLKLLLIIDQCEELVTLCQNDQERERFLSSLGEALIAYPAQLRVVLTLRSHFEPQFSDTALKIETLKPYWKPEARFVVPTMTPEELRQVIEEPAAARAVYFESPELVNQLIDEVAEMPGVLPLLSFTLSELYRMYLESEREDRTITQTDYKELGGVTRSLFQRANKVYQELFESDKAYAQTIRHVMLRMVGVGWGELPSRKVPLTELDYPENSENKRLVSGVIESFSTARLLITNAEGKSYVEPAHDKLVLEWPKLVAWKKDDQENLVLQRLLTLAATEWDNHNQEDGYLWDDNPRLLLVEQVFKSDDNNWLNQLETEFFKSSICKKRKEEQEEKRRRIDAEIRAANAFAITLFTSNKEIEALVESLKAGIQLKQASEQAISINFVTQTKALSALQQIVYGVSERNRLDGHNGWVRNVNFSRDSKIIATSSDDKTIKLWSFDGKLLKTLQGHNDTVTAVSFSPDGETIVSASYDKTINIWSLDGTLIKTIDAHNYPIWDVSFSPDGKTIASASADETIKLWNLNGTLIQTIQAHETTVTSVSFSPDEKTIASASHDGTVRLWSLDGTLLKTLQGDNDNTFGSGIVDISFSPDGKTVASAIRKGTINIWNIDGTLLKTFQGHDRGINSLSLSSDGKTLAFAGDDQTVKLWSIDGTLLKTLKGHTNMVLGVSFSPDGKTIASASGDATVKLWDFNGNSLKTWDGNGSAIFDLSFSPDGNTIASASQGYIVELWRLDGHLLKTFPHNGNVEGVSFSRDGKILASTDSGDYTVKLWNTDGTLLKTLKGHTAGVRDVSFNLDGSKIASASADGTIKLWNLDGNLLKTFPSQEANDVYSVIFSPDGKMLVSANWDRTVKLWSIDGTLLQTWNGHSDIVTSVSFNTDGKTIASASYDGTVKIWSVDEPFPVKTLKGHTSSVRDVSFSPDGQIIASTGDDETVKLWSLNGSEITTLTGNKGGGYSVRFSPNGKVIATGDYEGTIVLWNLDLDDLIVRGCNWVRDYLKTNPNAKEDRHLCDGIGASSS